MRVTILGATGRIGRFALQAALGAGHEVTVLTRQPDLVIDSARVVQGAITNPEAVGRAVEGTQAVIAAVGPRQNTPDAEAELELGTRTLVAAMRAAAVTRLVALSGAGIDVPGDRKPAVDRLVSRLVRLTARHVVGAKQREFAVFAATDLAWTAVRPAIVTDGNARGYRLSLTLKPGARSTRADVGQALVDQLGDDTFVREAPFVLPPDR
jgi:putative NADH-flavin reductase